MRFNQQVLLKHEHGITAQWMADDYSNMAIATYQQEKGTGTDVDGNQIILKKWVFYWYRCNRICSYNNFLIIYFTIITKENVIEYIT